MKKSILLLFLIFGPLMGRAQVYESQYAVFDRKVVLVRGIKESSELVCVVPKGNPVAAAASEWLMPAATHKTTQIR